MLRPELKQKWRSRSGKMAMMTKRRRSPERAGEVEPKWAMVMTIAMRTGAMKRRSGSKAQRPSMKASERDLTALAFS